MGIYNEVTNESFQKRVEQRFGNTIEFLEDFKTLKSKIKVRCLRCNTEQYITPNALLYETHKDWCNVCAKRITKKEKQEKFNKDIYNLYHGEYQALTPYHNCKEKVLFLHNKKGCLNQFWVTPDSFLNKMSGCPICKHREGADKLFVSDSEFKERINKIHKGHIIVLSEYHGNHEKVLIKHTDCGRTFETIAGDLLQGKGCRYCAGKMLKTTDQFKQEITQKYGNEYTVLGEYINAKTKVLVRHNNCGYEWYPMPSNILRGENCPVCRNSSKSVFKGVNDMWTTNPELAKLLANPKDGYKYTQCSNQYVDWKCPNCGNIIKNKMINQIQRAGLSCRRCGDGISYPEKFMYSFLQQLHINFITQYSHTNANWCSYNNYRVMYDFYIPLLNCIIETHGLQHYKERDTSSIYHNTLRKEQENDKFKKQLAIRNGIKEENYIVIDCRCSTIEWIKNSILHSQLSKLFDLSQINWIECHKYAVNSLVKLVCEYKKGHNDLTFVQTGKHFNLGRQTIRKYLKQGEKLGWFDYNCNNKELSSTKVYCVELNKIYESISSAMKLLNISNHHIGDCCKDRNKTAGGYHWMYYEDYLNIK